MGRSGYLKHEYYFAPPKPFNSITLNIPISEPILELDTQASESGEFRVHLDGTVGS